MAIRHNINYIISKYSIKNAYSEKNVNIKKDYNGSLIDIIKDKRVKKINYSLKDNKEAYDYVQGLFPKINIKNIDVYDVPHNLFVHNNMSNWTGFFDPNLKVILISDKDKDRFSFDDILVHELIHFGIYKMGLDGLEYIKKEELVYGKSLNYMIDVKKYPIEKVYDIVSPFCEMLVLKHEIYYNFITAYIKNNNIEDFKIDDLFIDEIIRENKDKIQEEISKEGKKAFNGLMKKYTKSEKDNKNLNPTV